MDDNLQNGYCEAVLPNDGLEESSPPYRAEIDGEPSTTGHERRQQQEKSASQPSAMEMEGVYGLQKIGQPVPPFHVSTVRRKNENGASLCLAVGCEKNAQANTRINNTAGFCRLHYNSWLISTGQIESWTCGCGNLVPMSRRCGRCHRWESQGGHSSLGDKAKSKAPAKGPATTTAGLGETALDCQRVVRIPPGMKIAKGRKRNEKGKPLCKVEGCDKLDQNKNNGFCRMHYNMFSVESSLEKWVCVCGVTMPGKQKRCGKCNKVSVASPPALPLPHCR